MISRIWHGYTTPENAGNFEDLLKREIFVETKNRQIKGYHGIDLLKRTIENEVEFISNMWFESINSVIEYAGKDYELSVVPEKAQRLLLRYDSKVQHYEVLNKA
jgi:hypothetical protein